MISSSSWTHFVDSWSWTFLTQILGSRKKVTTKGWVSGCQGLTGQLLSLQIHQVSEVIYSTHVRTAWTQEWCLDSKVLRSLRHKPIYLLIFQKKGNCQKDLTPVFLTSTFFPHSSIPVWLGAGNLKLDRRCVDRENWSSNPRPSDSKAQLSCNYALVRSQWPTHQHDIYTWWPFHWVKDVTSNGAALDHDASGYLGLSGLSERRDWCWFTYYLWHLWTTRIKE